MFTPFTRTSSRFCVAPFAAMPRDQVRTNPVCLSRGFATTLRDKIFLFVYIGFYTGCNST
jgi:hypothetical protein